MNRKTISIIVLAVVAAVIGGATAAYGAMSSTVTLTVDGRAEKIRVFGDSVGDLLDARDIKVTDADRVSLDRSHQLADGDVLDVAYARPLKLVVDGKKSTETVHEPTVGQALKALDVDTDRQDFVSEPTHQKLPRKGSELVVSTEKTIGVVADGKKKKITTNAPTYGDVVKKAGIEVGKDDMVGTRNAKKKLVDATEAYTVPGKDVRIVRIKKETKTEEVPVDFSTTVQKDDQMAKGDVDVVTKGVKGKNREKVEIVYADGKVQSRKVLDREVLVKPKAQVEKHGTKVEPTEPAAQEDSPSVAGDSVWDKIAQCESGGNWHINTGNGYYGGLQFSAATWKSVGGPGLPHEQSRETQIKYAKILQARSGWGQWGCAGARFN